MYGVNNQRRVQCAVSKWHAMRPANEPCPDCGPPVAVRHKQHYAPVDSFYTWSLEDMVAHVSRGNQLSPEQSKWFHDWTLGVANGVYNDEKRPPIPVADMSAADLLKACGVDDSDSDTDAFPYVDAFGGVYP